MAYSHVAHDCVLQDYVILGNSTQLAGEVEIDDYAIMSGGTLVHQFSKIGAHVMIQGGSRVAKDIPPFIMVGREPISFVGLNVVGLRRRGFTGERINAIRRYIVQFISPVIIFRRLLSVWSRICRLQRIGLRF